MPVELREDEHGRRLTHVVQGTHAGRRGHNGREQREAGNQAPDVYVDHGGHNDFSQTRKLRLR